MTYLNILLATSVLSSVAFGQGAGAIPDVTNPGVLSDAYQVNYIANLNVGDGGINITNTGALGTDAFGPLAGTNGRICVNVYTFSPDQQEISCCSCLVTPNSLTRLSARIDLIQDTLTGVVPNSIVVKLLATIPRGAENPTGTNAGPFTGSTCNAATPFESANLAPGVRAWATTLHPLPTNPTSYAITKDAFLPANLSAPELSKLTALCRFLVGNGTGPGICKSCALGGEGAN